jgi:hypothetical protein
MEPPQEDGGDRRPAAGEDPQPVAEAGGVPAVAAGEGRARRGAARALAAAQAEDEMASTRGCKMKMTVPLGLPNEPSDDDVIALMHAIDDAVAQFYDDCDVFYDDCDVDDISRKSCFLRALIGWMGLIIDAAPPHVHKPFTEELMRALAHTVGYLASPFELRLEQ